MTKWIFYPSERDVISCDETNSLAELRIKASKAQIPLSGNKKELCRLLLSEEAYGRTKSVVSALEKHLAGAYPLYDLEVEVLPDIMCEHPGGVCGTYRIQISLPQSGCRVNEALAILAHECGHIGQVDIDELEAWQRGVYWANEWGVKKEYFNTINREIYEYRKEGSIKVAKEYGDMLHSIGG